jgi:hypothetical protein
MSTKASLKHGENFHFYEECLDQQNVFLCLRDSNPQSALYVTVTIDGSYKEVTLQIPRIIWNSIVEIGQLPVESEEPAHDV